ncbi:hypothetical protein BBBOND_0104100 [Babesia bigemina]|uniref:Uncharacterized protein n=1 Tax=Babesia bigemina TaxID=5866 RepID=A0A061CZQ1_BABBI|nr:hypothetical protein BBBOND_0104100 [Babesia bigemina]CDR94101.1 hypothetical protein BBBOND_0104100 [Babesia bigemina]|eukprot:XP_012766287.1 hypothetical protein BBBOND_0104100 [Babesia bigemina]
MVSGESLRHFIFDRAFSVHREFQELQYHLPASVGEGARLLATVATILTNLIPLVLPLMLTNFFNRVHTQQQAR